MDNNIQIEGVVTKIVFTAKDSTFVICRVSDKDGREYSVKGIIPFCTVGDTYRVVGEAKRNEKFPDSLDITLDKKRGVSWIYPKEDGLDYAWCKTLKLDKQYRDIKKKGSGLVTLFDRIKNYSLLKEYNCEKELQRANNYILRCKVGVILNKINLRPNQIEQVISEHGYTTSLNLLEHNPYELSKLDKINFRTLDAGLLNAGLVTRNSKERLSALLEYALDIGMSKKGNTWLSEKDIQKECSKLNSLGGKDVVRRWAEIKKYAVENDRLKVLGERFTTKKMDDDESLISKFLITLNNESCDARKVKIPGILNNEQKKAVKNLQEGVSVLTGGPGTGKTFTLNQVSKNMKGRVIGLAPTGKAAKRLAESLGVKTFTIHKFLKDISQMKGSREKVNIIIDEASMLSTELFAELIRGLEEKIGMERLDKMVIVGDDDQLPSIAPGRVLYDIIHGKWFPVTRLTQVMRQGQESGIVKNAALISKGKKDLEAKDDFYITNTKSEDTIRGLVKKAFEDRLTKVKKDDGSKLDLKKDVQIMTPKNRGNLGVEGLNNMIQDIMNPKDPSKKEINLTRFFSDGSKYKFQLREGDKALVCRNNKNLGVVNGDIGFVTEINKGCAVINIDDEEVHFSGEDLNDVNLGWAVTVHKMQGSEVPFAIVVVPESKQGVLNDRSVIYTAITRGKEKVWVIGDKDTVDRCIDTQKANDRKTSLCERCCKDYEIIESIKKIACKPIDL